MKYDTLQFASLPSMKHYNFVQENSRGDPFLINASVAGNIVAGKNVRRGRDMGNIKRVLPLQEGDMNKAKACEEMIFYEQNPHPHYDKHGNIVKGGPGTFPPPDEQIVLDFEEALGRYISDTGPEEEIIKTDEDRKEEVKVLEIPEDDKDKIRIPTDTLAPVNKGTEESDVEYSETGTPGGSRRRKTNFEVKPIMDPHAHKDQ